MNSHRQDTMHQELELRKPKDAFLAVLNQANLLKALKKFQEVTLIIFSIGTRGDDVVDVGEYIRESSQRSPKGMRIYSNRLKCVVVAVFGMSKAQQGFDDRPPQGPL